VVFQDSRLLPLAPRARQRAARHGRQGGRRTRARRTRRGGLAGRERAWPNELSGGEGPSAPRWPAPSCGKPELLLADEPFGALDALTRIRMHALLRELWQRHRPSVLLVTHDVDEAIVLADGSSCSTGAASAST